MIDLTGQKYGKLTVLDATEKRFHRSVVWRCRCDCGDEREVPSQYLRNGTVTSCGLSHQKEFKPRRIWGSKKIIPGMVFGELTTIRPTDRRIKGCVVWECKCSCGKTAYVQSARLSNGNTKSCGHLRLDLITGNNYRTNDITGYRSGRLVADHRVGTYQGKGAALWLCKCDCGKDRVCLASQIIYKKVKSCGCAHKIYKSNAYMITCPSCGNKYYAESLEDAPQFCPDCTKSISQ